MYSIFTFFVCLLNSCISLAGVLKTGILSGRKTVVEIKEVTKQKKVTVPNMFLKGISPQLERFGTAFSEHLGERGRAYVEYSLKQARFNAEWQKRNGERVLGWIRRRNEEMKQMRKEQE